jgi:hypothetical protein
MKRHLRQARYLTKPEVREAKREKDHDYYLRNRDRFKTRARARQLLGGDPEKLEALRKRFRIVGPGDLIPLDASQTTRNSCGTKTNTRGDAAFVMEAKRPLSTSPWEYAASCPDLSTMLGLWGKGQGLEEKEFIRDEMLRRFPERFPHPEDLPTEDEVLRRNVGPPDIREREKRIRQARMAQLTPDFQCPHGDLCDYFGPMIPTGKGPYPAGKFLSPDGMEKLGAGVSDLLPGVYCPQCRGLVLFPKGTDVSRPPGSGNAAEIRCECGFLGRPGLELATQWFICPECGRVVGYTLDDRPNPPRRRSNSVA